MINNFILYQALLLTVIFDFMNRSLRNTMQRDWTKDKDKAKKLLDLELNSITSKEYDPNNVPIRNRFNKSSHAGDNKKQPTTTQHGQATAQREEQNILSKMFIGRNQLFLEPFDVFDPHHPIRGKKRFDPNFRPLRSKINIKINA